MSNTIKLKRGSGSDPSASDLVVGELAIRTDSGKIFTKKDNGSVAEISGGGGIDDGDKGDITISNGGDTFTIDNGVVTGAKLANIISLSDSQQLRFGDSNDLIIQHNGSDSIVQENGTGNLVLKTNGTGVVITTGSGAQIAEFNNNSTCVLRHQTNERFATSSTGVSVTGNIAGTGNLTLTSTDAGSSASPIIELYRNSSSPADADYLGQIKFTGEDAADNKQVYAKITGKADDVTNATEDGILEFMLTKAGSNNIAARFTSTDLKLINGTGLEVAGNISCDGTVDGVDIAARDTLFGGLTSSSGVLSNGVTATTQSAGNNTTRVATTAFVSTAIANLVDSAPGTLNTLNELAAALGDDANFSTTVTNSIATKMPLAGGQFTGNITFSGSQTVDGRDLSVDGAKLDGIESNATADQTASEILSLLSNQNITTSGTLDTGNATLNNANITQRTDGSTDNGVFINSGDTGAGNRPNLVLKGAGSAGLGQEAIQVYYNNGSNKTFDLDYNGNIEARNISLTAGADITGNITCTGTVDGRDLATDGTKLDGIESNATADQTASEILTLIKTVDGAGSGLDADTLDGLSSASFVRSDANDTMTGNLIINNSSPSLTLTDNNNNPDYQIGNSNGTLRFRDTTAASNRMTITSSAVDINVNLDANSGLDVTGDISVSGTVDGRDVASDGSKLDGIESGATADQTNSEIKTAYEANSNTNAFTDALLSKLNGIAASATNVTNNNQLTNGAGYITATLTNEQVQDIVGGMVSSNTESGITVTYQDSDGTLDFSVASQTDNNFTNADHSKLDGIEANATADQTASEILTLIKTVDGSGSGLDADVVDGIQASSFLRSDANDTASGIITLSNSSRDCLNFSASATDDNRGIAFNGRIAVSADHNDGWLRLNNSGEFSNGVYTLGKIRADGGINVDNSTVIDGSGNIVASKVPTLNQNTTGSSGSCTGNAATATRLQTARTIAGVSFNGTANISLNNNAITNGAGYVTSSVINSLNASNLSSGTIPDARFPSTLPAVDGSNLTGISAGATGGGSDEVFYENDQTVTTNYTITNGKNAMAAGPITINSGVTVTVGSGETLTIV